MASPVLQDLVLPLFQYNLFIFLLGSFIPEEAADSSRLLVTTYHTIWCKQKDYNQNLHYCEIVESHNKAVSQNSAHMQPEKMSESYYSYATNYKLTESNYLITLS
jgi:hypothetical protein